MKSNHFIFLYFLIGLLTLALGYLLVEREEKQRQSPNRQPIIQESPNQIIPRVKIFDLPDKPEFAGEEVPKDIPDVYERYEREIYVNAYWESNMLLMMKRAGKFFPYIEKTLTENGIPEDFKYVALAESGLLNIASPAGAEGFWQFMAGTAKEYGLEVNREIDERYHFEKSTLAACKYLRWAYGKFGNWTSVAASYNMGVSGITKRKNAQMSQNYYDLFLNEETSRYLFRILAFKAIFEHPGEYGFVLQRSDIYALPPLKEIVVKESIPDLAKWAIDQKSNYKEIKIYNPWLRNTRLTIRKGQSYTIKIPV
ncbi:MAG: lytic transglycosylase domain-containing protein [Cyclobacteriaceae bacterium]